MSGDNLLGIPETRLEPDPAAAALARGVAPADVARDHPASSLAWATLAEDALQRDDAIAAYAYARTGYHRGLDALRRAGWRGQGPVPWEHEPNRGFLRALAALSKAAGAIGETDEQRRCADFLRDSSATGARELGL
ncbi:DUF3151 domain-containing protein [Calidifontibacter sp. DB0510]|uniref:DUF3151 domain-containing protein n=1 Tax=Metallococcus carri TaxID=1656884 RepID=A0A967AYM1_9MICO|nr:DUF3151 domain-containing protein [Metallococcus carri]NHN55446.1 DUF3151 domain-containing protein [Metallococcus carri]NOP38370.1 DUF3151 family protein [Calidifontibacter sp. DB2511S]